MQWMLDQLMKNAPFGNDYTPRPPCRMHVLPNENNQQTNQSGFSFLEQPNRHQKLDMSFESSDTQHSTTLSDNTQQESSSRSNIITSDQVTSSEEDSRSKRTTTDCEKQPVSSDQPIKSSNESTNSLERVISVTLQQQPLNKIKLKEMYKELIARDSDNSGKVDENQLKNIAISLEVPLKAETLTSLCRKFSDREHPQLVYFDELMKFIADRLTSSSTEPISSQESVSASKSTTTQKELDDILRSYSVDEKHVAMLKDQMMGAGNWHLDKLYEALQEADRFNHKRLSSNIIVSTCIRQRVPLTNSLILKLMEAARIDNQNINWREFLAPIIRACTEIYPITETEPENTPGCILSRDPSPEKNALREIRKEENISSEENVTEGSQNLDSSTEQFPHCLHNSKRTAGSSWNRNFAKLSIALKTYNPYKADRMPKHEVERILHNYNLIYELNLSDEFMEEAVKRAVVSKEVVGREVTETVSLNKLLILLNKENP